MVRLLNQGAQPQHEPETAWPGASPGVDPCPGWADGMGSPSVYTRHSQPPKSRNR